MRALASAALSVVGAIATVAYPALVYVGLTRWSARAVGLALLAALALRTALSLRARAREHLGHVLRVPLVVGAMVTAGALLDDHRAVLLVPVAINAALLATFGLSLRGPVPMVERFARMQEPDLTPAKVAWCRAVTAVWCGFFAANGLAALVLALAAPLAWWALYTGAIAYALMGALFAGEWVLRRLRFGAPP